MRTFAIMLMIVFHFIYDLNFFSLIEFDIPDGNGWREFRWLIISLFFLSLGASLRLSHCDGFHFKAYLSRLVKITAAAAMISLATLFFIPDNWIFFGVLHFLAISSVIAIFFIHIPNISLVLGLLFLVIGALEIIPSRWPFYLLFDNLPSYTNDYVAFFPWFGMVLIGIYISKLRIFLNDPLNSAFDRKTQSLLVWPGKHSLSIYLLHQPILISAVFAYSKLSELMFS